MSIIYPNLTLLTCVTLVSCYLVDIKVSIHGTVNACVPIEIIEWVL